MEEVLAMREVASSVEYLVKWLGYNRQEDNTWEPQQNLRCGQKILDFQKKLKIETSINDDITKLEEMTQKYNTKQVEPLKAVKNQTKLDIDLGFCKIYTNDSMSVAFSYKHNKCHQVSSLDVCPCTICDEWFPSVQDLEKHLRFHDKSKDPSYPYCNVCKFSSKAKILNKGQTGHLETGLLRNICNHMTKSTGVKYVRKYTTVKEPCKDMLKVFIQPISINVISVNIEAIANILWISMIKENTLRTRTRCTNIFAPSAIKGFFSRMFYLNI